MHPQLDGYRSAFVDQKNEVETLFDTADPDVLRTPPDPDTWSAVQCIDHLNTTGWLLLRSMEEAIRTAQGEGPYGEPPFEYGFVSRWFIRAMTPSSGWTFTTFSMYEPADSQSLYPDEVSDEFLTLQDQFAECVTASERLDLRGLRIPSPALPLLRISLGAWYEAIAAHEHRHIEQARRSLHTVTDSDLSDVDA